MSDKRFLLAFGRDDQELYLKQARALAAAFGRLGVFSAHYPMPTAAMVKAQLDKADFREAIKRDQITDVVTINVPQGVTFQGSETPLVMWHTWVQDAYDANLDFYTKADGETRWNWARCWGEPMLLPATDYGRYDLLEEKERTYDFDVSFAGYLPNSRLNLEDVNDNEIAAVQANLNDVVAMMQDGSCGYESWKASLDLTLALAESRTGYKCPPRHRGAIIRYLGATVARRVQRYEMVEAAEKVCKAHGWRLGLAGRTWADEFGDLAVGWKRPGIELATFYRRSKVSLHCNGEVLFHNRPLEIFAAGGFCLSVVSRDGWDAGLNLPKATAQTLEGMLEATVEDKDGFWKAEAVRIAAEVREKHSWDSRAKQLLEAP